MLEVDLSINQAARFAARYGKDTELKMFLDFKLANVSELYNGNTLLHIALGKEDVSTLDLLMRYGSNASQCNAQGQSSLEIAENDGIHGQVMHVLTTGSFGDSDSFMIPPMGHHYENSDDDFI